MTSIILLIVVEVWLSANPGDLHVYGRAAEQLQSGSSPYASLDNLMSTYGGVTQIEWRYLYPPFLVTILKEIPFGWSGLYCFWLFVTTIAVISILHSTYRVTERALWPLLTVAPFGVDSLSRGQIDLWVLALLLIFLRGQIEKNPRRTSGLALALAAHLKATPVLIACAFLNGGTKKQLFQFVIGAISILLITFYLGGVELWLQFFSSARATAMGEQGWLAPENLSLSKLVYESGVRLTLLSSSQETVTNLITLQSAAVFLISIVVSVALRAKSDSAQLTAVLSILMLNSSPLLWYAHGVVLLLPLIVLQRESPTTLRFTGLSCVLCLGLYRYFEVFLCQIFNCSALMTVVEPIFFFLIAVLLLNFLLLRKNSCSTG